MDSRKKYLNQGAFAYPHIGNLISKQLSLQNLPKSELARRIGVKTSVIYPYLKQESLQFGILWKISIAMNHNFFADLMSYLPKDMLEGNENFFFKRNAGTETRE
jgi:hypothetical protein